MPHKSDADVSTIPDFRIKFRRRKADRLEALCPDGGRNSLNPQRNCGVTSRNVPLRGAGGDFVMNVTNGATDKCMCARLAPMYVVALYVFHVRSERSARPRKNSWDDFSVASAQRSLSGGGQCCGSMLYDESRLHVFNDGFVDRGGNIGKHEHITWNVQDINIAYEFCVGIFEQNARALHVRSQCVG